MFAELEALPLVGGTDSLTINTVRRLGKSLINETSENLAVLDHERDIVGPNLKDGSAATSARRVVSEPGIEETGVVDSKFTNQRVVGDHFGRMVGRNGYRLKRCEDVEIVRIQDDCRLFAPIDWFPKIDRVVLSLAVEVDQAGILARAKSDHAGLRIAFEIDSEGNAIF